MAKKKTQIDRAIESFEADLASMTLVFESQTAAIKAAISKLRDQQQSRPKRRSRATSPVEYATQPE